MTLRILTGGTFSNPALPVFNPNLFGFPQRGLVALHRLADASPAAGSKDDVGGTSIAPVANTGVAANLSGGGLRLTKNAIVSVASAVDITQPYTFAVGLAVNLASTGNTGIVSAIDYPARGWNIYCQPGVTSTSTPVAGTWRQSVDGVQSATGIAALPGAAWYFGRGATVLLRHQGGGIGTVDVYCGATATLMFSQAITLDTTGQQGAAGSKTTPVKFCAGSPTWTGGELNVESFAVWNKALALADAAAVHNANAALASARGRTWS